MRCLLLNYLRFWNLYQIMINIGVRQLECLTSSHLITEVKHTFPWPCSWIGIHSGTHRINSCTTQIGKVASQPAQRMVVEDWRRGS